MAWFIGCDVGGTFTDFHAVDAASGRSVLHKTASTPDNPARAVIEGLKALAVREGIPLDAIGRLSHGTTVATNALLQGKGADVALVTTKGFRDLLEIGRQIRPHMFDLQKDFPPPLVPRQRRLEAEERVMADGRVLRPLGEGEVRRTVAAVRATRPGAIAVCFLFTFRNPRHEQELKVALQAAMPDVPVSVSTEVQPEFREYERLSTTVLNAYLQPLMARYMRSFEDEVKAVAPAAVLGINQSQGGLMSPARARQLPIRTALSGPAAGVVGSIDAARQAGMPNVITLDMGGTSADVCLVREAAAELTYERWIEGYPARLASVDVNAVGAGGGSIAWFERDGLMKVGPASAGALPGPACYGQGGQDATVTDANLALGRLSPRGLLGGGMKLDVTAARAALAGPAARLGFGIERTAHGIIGIVVANMVRALRAISVERGHDPRGFALLAFGGAGPLHASDVARAVGIRQVLVPPAPGILCAKGLIVSDLRESFVASGVTPVDAARLVHIAGELEDLARRAVAWLRGEGVAPEQQSLQFSLDMRYVGQNYELSVPLDEGAAARPNVAELTRRFFAAHERSYGYFNPEDAVEIVNFRLTALGRLETPKEPPLAPATSEAAATDSRPVSFDGLAFVDTPVYWREHLAPGHRLAGPAVVEQLDATTLIFPGERGSVDAAGNLILEVRS